MTNTPEQPKSGWWQPVSLLALLILATLVYLATLIVWAGLAWASPLFLMFLGGAPGSSQALGGGLISLVALWAYPVFVVIGLLIGWAAFFFKNPRARLVSVSALMLPLLAVCVGATSAGFFMADVESSQQATRAVNATQQALITPHAETFEFQSGTPAPFSKTPAPATSELIFASPPDSLPPLTLNYKLEKDLNFFGTYQNPNDYPIQVSVVITLFDAEEKFIGKQSEFIGVLNPGQRKPFKVTFYEMQYKNLAGWASYKLEFSGQSAAPASACDFFEPQSAQITKRALDYEFTGEFRARQSLAYPPILQVAFYNEDWDLLAYEHINFSGGIAKDTVYPLQATSLHVLSDLRAARYFEFVCTR